MFKPEYNISNKILIDIGKIEACQEIIRHSPILPLWEKQFRNDAIVRAVYHGTHLEGNLLDKNDAENLLLGKEVIGRQRDIQEVINYRKVLQVADEELNKANFQIDETFIIKLHKIIVHNILPEESAGQYRLKQVVIKNSQTGEITFRPPPPIGIPFLMQSFLAWLQNTSADQVHPVIKAGIAHHEFVRIHPFIDGNGRLARLIATLILMSGGYDIRQFFALEEYYDRDADSYYASLQRASDGDLTSWLEYFVHGVALEFTKVKEKVLRLSQDEKLKERFGGKQIYLNDRQMRIIEHIQKIGFIQNRNFRELFPDFSEDTILRDLQALIKNKLVRKIGSTKAARYITN